MINVVGAGEDPENLTPATLYNFTPAKKAAPAPVKPTDPPAPIPVAATPITPPQTPVETTPAAAPTAPPAPPTPTALKPQKSLKTLVVAGVLGLLLLIGGTGAALYLGQSNQDVRQQASTELPDVQPTIQPTLEPEPTLEPTSEPTAEPTAALDAVETLALGPTLTPTPEATTPTPILIDTTEFCGQSCVTDENCENPTHSCVSGSCKLTTNQASLSCKTPSGSSQIEWDSTQPQREYSPYATPSGETPQSGPADWLHYWWLGLGALGIGAALLLVL